MEKQGGSLADRPRMIAAGEMLSGGLAIGFTHAGDRLHRMRRFVVRHTAQIVLILPLYYFCRVLHTHLQPKAAETYEPLQMSHAKKVVLDILEDPSDFLNHAAT